MKKLILLLLFATSPLWASTIVCQESLEIIRDGDKVGRFEDAVKNFASDATAIKNAVKAVVEAKALDADTVKEAKRDSVRTAAAGITLSTEAQAAIDAVP